MYKTIIRPILFLWPAETIHEFSTSLLKIVNKIPGMNSLLTSQYQVKNPKLKKELFGLTFDNPVGLAAGFDKDAKLIDEIAALGFGFIEIGTLTPRPQDGNPKPRLFRLKQDQGIINRMGFNNGGVEAALPRLASRKTKLIIGGNIGKNKITPNEDALDDYVTCFNQLYPYVDYFVLNVSSPNTPNLRELQEKEPLKKLLSEVRNLSLRESKYKPILLKIAPDLSEDQLHDIVSIVVETKIDGIIATNTTISRDNLIEPKESVEAIGAGGLSGKPLQERSTEVIRFLRNQLPEGFPIIGVGGISSVEAALEKLDAGADLIQIYTGFIYEGPSFPKKINKAIIVGSTR